MNSYEEVIKLKRLILGAAKQAGEGHVASAFSILDVLYVLYDKFVTHDPSNPNHELRDYVVLSKGHGSLALYAVLANKGFFPFEDLLGFCSFKSNLGGHPSRLTVPGVEASTGSLGHGLPIAVGIAKGLKIDGKNNHVYCIVGDGELNEGTNWEAAMLAAEHKLDNLTVIVDHNGSGNRAIEPRPFWTDKLEAFGFCVAEGYGHDHGILYRRLALRTLPGMPQGLVLHTTKGKGVQEMENNPAWHHRAPNDLEFRRFSAELE